MSDEDKELVANMRETISEWMEDEPFDDWFLYQRDFAKAADRIEAQAAEIERLRSLIDVTANHWLALQDKHPLNWEGAIDGAMAAACAEIVKLREALREVTPPPHFGESEQNKAWWAKAREALGETK